MLSIPLPVTDDKRPSAFTFFISNKCTLVLLDAQAMRFLVGWNMILLMIAYPEPLLSSCTRSPSSTLKILIRVPLIEALANNVPSEFIAKAAISYS